MVDLGADVSDRSSSGVRLGRAAEGHVTFGIPVVATDGSGYTRMPLVIEAQGLSATSTVELEDWGGGAPSLIAYFADMAADWRGWDGVKEWHDDGGALGLSATHDGIGTIALTVSATPNVGWAGPGSWQLEAVVALDPGSLDTAVTELRRLLQAAPKSGPDDVDPHGR